MVFSRFLLKCITVKIRHVLAQLIREQENHPDSDLKALCFAAVSLLAADMTTRHEASSTEQLLSKL